MLNFFNFLLNHKENEFKDDLVNGRWGSENAKRLIQIMDNVEKLISSKTPLIPYYRYEISWYGARLAHRDVYIIIDKYGVPKISLWDYSLGDKKRTDKEKDKILASLMTYDEVKKYAEIGLSMALKRNKEYEKIEKQNNKIGTILGCNFHSTNSICEMM